MKSTTVTSIAAWVLLRMYDGPHRDVVLGDLLEAYAEGRSALWLLWQVAATVVIGAIRQITDHRVDALRAVTVGWLSWLLFMIVFETIRDQFITGGLVSIRLWLHVPVGGPLWWILSRVVLLCTGWIVVRCCSTARAGALFAYVTSQLLCFSFWFAWWGMHLVHPSPIALLIDGASSLTSTLVGGLLGQISDSQWVPAGGGRDRR